MRSDGVQTAYLLEAGFSKSIAPVMPLMPQLGAEVLDALEFPLSTLHPYEDNLEIWLAWLSSLQPWLTEAQVLHNRGKFLEVSEAIQDSIAGSESKAFQDPLPLQASRLVWHMSRNRANVMTFNYDRLVESIAVSLGAGNTFDDVYSAALTERARPGSGAGPGPREAGT